MTALALPGELDIGDLLLPGPGDGLALLRALTAHRRRDDVLGLVRGLADDAGASEAERAVAVRLTEAVEALPDSADVDAFGTPFAQFDAMPDPSALEHLVDARTARQRAMSCARLLAGVPDAPELHVALPPSAFPHGALHLPHLGVTIANRGGPVALGIIDEVVRLTWEDGYVSTLPAGGPPEGAVPLLERIAAVSRVEGIPVLNGLAPDVEAVFATFEPAGTALLASMNAVASDALQLLREIWPEAALMARRWLSGYLMLRPREGTRSHTSPVLPGVVLTSANDPVGHADLLCHELAHARATMVLQIDPLLEDDGEVYPSPWRPDPRPLLGVLLGVHAFLNVCHFYRRFMSTRGPDPRSEWIYASQSTKVRDGMTLLRNAARPTPVGTSVLDALESEVDGL